MNKYSYVGTELELFRKTVNWKNYYRDLIKNYLGDEVLEVGAGIGATTQSLCSKTHKRWVCLEPDPLFINTLNQLILDGHLPKACESHQGTLLNLHPDERFDTIIYIDVLEHIEQDRAEIYLAANYLREGGILIVLSPAHQWLFTPFDETIGHYRRYNKNSLSIIVPKSFECISLMYLDSVGLVASLGNRLILKSKMPTRKQISFWDKRMVPLSIRLDPLLQYSVGKSLLGIWQKNF